jgi:short-subunit dehydrogenase
MRPSVSWSGSVAVVTGASRGIGRSVAIAASRRGARVGLVARSGGDLASVRAELAGPSSVAVADVSSREAVEDGIGRIVDALGPVDILVNNAGAGAYGPLLDAGVELIEQLMQVNYLGTVYPTLAVLPGMYERGRGHVVNVASVAGRIGAPFETAYSATKFAVVGLTEALALEAAAHRVGVSLVDPGPVATEFFARRGALYARRWPRAVPPGRVADAVLRAVDRGYAEQYVPRWLGLAHVVKTLAPPLYRAGARPRGRRS